MPALQVYRGCLQHPARKGNRLSNEIEKLVKNLARVAAASQLRVGSRAAS